MDENDLSLLKAAAAATKKRICSVQHSKLNCYGADGRRNFHWNPLTDDADAFRLASELKLDVLHRDDMALVALASHGLQLREPYGIDRDAAVRRAIVRAAAWLHAQLLCGR